MEYEALTGPEKVAIVILSMPSELVKEFLSQLGDDEVEKALAAVSRLDEIPPPVQEKVLKEFRETLGQHDYVISGGRKRALDLIEHGLDATRAASIRENLGRDEKRVDWTLRAYRPEFIAEQIREEHPQTIALVLSQLPADRGAKVIQELPEEVQPEVVLRVAGLDTVTTDVLNRVPKSDGTEILNGVDTRDPAIAGAIRKRMLTFNDLESIDRRGFQILLREVATEDLAVALKAGSDEMRDKVFANLSSRAADQIKEEIDLLGPMKLSDVEAVQEQIVDVARRLEEEGRLTIDVGSSDDVLV